MQMCTTGIHTTHKYISLCSQISSETILEKIKLACNESGSPKWVTQSTSKFQGLSFPKNL